jgi:hypothetical protein
VQPVTTFELFQVAERIELGASELYGLLARQFAEDEPARVLFVRLEQEENQHASRVRLLASQYRADAKLVGNVAGAGVLSECEFQLQVALAEVRAGAWGRELGPVRERLARLEASLAHAHAQALAVEANPGLREFLRQLSQQDRAHQELLKDA